MLFKKSNEELTQKLENLFAKESKPKTDAQIFNLATQLVNEDISNYKALYILAQCYHFGIGTTANFEKAAELYENLTKNSGFDNNDVRFQYKFATALSETNNSNCFIWYLKASLNGDQYSTYLIGEKLLDSDLMVDIPYVHRYELATNFIEKSIQMNLESDVTTHANDLLNFINAKHKIRMLEIKKQNLVFDLLKNNTFVAP